MRSYTTTILLTTLVAASIIAWLQSMANELYWYWVYWWFDIPMHVLGGFMIGLIVLFLLGRFSTLPLRGLQQGVLIVVFVLGVGLLWELFEWWAGVFVVHEPFPDSVYDLFADVAGGLIAYLYAIGVNRITKRY